MIIDPRRLAAVLAIALVLIILGISYGGLLLSSSSDRRRSALPGGL